MIYMASKTYKAINEALEADQGASFRGWQGKVLPHIGDAYRTETESHRSHMGASMIGDECPRKVWYNFRWLIKPKFPGRILRLFNRGHLEEGRFIALFLMIGCQVYQQDANGKQFRISDANGHFGGSGDGVVIGLPDLPPDVAALLEFKTHGEKSFLELQKKGVKACKWEHYVQMNVYMGKMGLTVALYGAVNKNTDEIHLEIVPYDPEVCAQYLERGRTLVAMTTPPPRMNESPGFYKCKWCDMNKVCHGISRGDVDLNCRTCEHSVIGPEPGQWVCMKAMQEIPKELQLTGCQQYEMKKDL